MQGTLSDIEYKLYKRWFNWAETLVKDIDYKHVYLKCAPETSFDRTVLRKRKEESNIPLEYITQNHDRHEEWLTGKENTITIDVSAEDYVKDDDTFKRLFSKYF